jgi:hypothetical protein
MRDLKKAGMGTMAVRCSVADAKGISLLVMGDACHLGSAWEREEQKGL